jgi:hypothetical protein
VKENEVGDPLGRVRISRMGSPVRVGKVVEFGERLGSMRYA